MAKKESEYSGFKELRHVVRKGESVSMVAANFRRNGWPVDRWEPIYDLTRLKTGLWERKGTRKQRYNPDLIYPGDVLLLPRSPAGYDRRIAELVRLAETVRGSGNEAAAIREEAKAFGEQIDLISDLLQLVATCGLSAAKAVKAAKAAKSATGLKAVERLAEKTDALKDIAREIGIFAVTKAAEKIGGSNAGYAAKAATKTRPKAVDMFAKSSPDTGIKLLTGKTYETALKAAKGIKAVGLSIARGADMILDFVNPSEVAKLYIYLSTGEKVDEVLDRAAVNEAEMKARSLELLADRAAALRAERAYLYEGKAMPERQP